MGDGFAICRPEESTARRQLPLDDRRGRLPCLGKMPRDHLRCLMSQLREVLEHGPRYAAVMCLAGHAQEGLVGHVAKQDVAKGISLVSVAIDRDEHPGSDQGSDVLRHNWDVQMNGPQ